jgi:light-regulated signal transduction histidine kinase (bacteriophytochrome)
LESANQELNDFAYIVSHDLKAPLRAIGSLANWISTDYADKLDDAGREQLRLLLSRVSRMHALIEGILQYSRVGRVREKKEEFALGELVPEVIDLIAPPETIEVKIETSLPSVLGEKTRIAQVFQNLLSNAVKYMDKGEGKIRIGCMEKDGHWVFNVADNGPGIEERHFGKIFQIFQTLKPRDEFESTGIGLAVVKKAVEMNGGKIWVESKVGSGSTFFFTLPKANH